jgi:hypothetical protein
VREVHSAAIKSESAVTVLFFPLTFAYEVNMGVGLYGTSKIRGITTVTVIELRNTVIYAFDPNSPKISAFDIHEWIHETLRIPEKEVTMIQIDGTKRHEYIKLVTEQKVQKIVMDTNGHLTYKHADGLISVVLIEIAGMGTKSIRIANLPPEVPEHKIQAAMTPYGKIISRRHEVWARTYRYAVPNGIRQINMSLQHHIPSHLIIV